MAETEVSEVVRRFQGELTQVIDEFNMNFVLNRMFQPRAYDRIARGEIVASDRFAGKHPDYVSLGVGSGKLFLAIERAIREQGLTTKLIGILPKGENGVFNEGQLVETEGRLFTKDPFNPQTIADKLSCPFTALRSELVAPQDAVMSRLKSEITIFITYLSMRETPEVQASQMQQRA